MRLTVYPSKLYTITLSLFACGIASIFFLAPKGLPDPAKWIVGIIAGAIVIGSLKGFISGKPVVTADEDGLHDARFGSKIIRWEEILAFRHAPRVGELANGERHFSLFDAWRPIQLWVDSQEKTLFTRLHRLKRAPKHPDFPHALYLEIDFSGMDTSSSRLAEAIREFAPNAKEQKS